MRFAGRAHLIPNALRVEEPFEVAIGEDEYTDVVLHLRAEPGATFRDVNVLVLEGALQQGPIPLTSSHGCRWAKLIEVLAPVSMSSAHRVRLPRAANRFRLSVPPGSGPVVIESLIALTRARPAGAPPVVAESLSVTRVETGSIVVTNGRASTTLPMSAVSPGLPPDLVSVLHPTEQRSVHLTADGGVRIETPRGSRSFGLAQSLLQLMPDDSVDAWTIGPAIWALLERHPPSTLLAHAHHDGLEAAAALLHDGSVRIRRGVDGQEVRVSNVDELAAVLPEFPSVPAEGRYGLGYSPRAQLVNQLRGALAPGSRAEREFVRFLSEEVVAPFREIAGRTDVVAGDRVQLCWDGPRRGAPRGLVVTLRQRDAVLVAVQHERMIQGGEFEIPLGLLPADQVPRAGMTLGLWREPRAR